MSETTEQEPRRRGRPALDEARRIDQRVLHIALETFDRTGFDATQMETIAKDAGISKAALYRRFQNKADLLLAVVRQVTHRLVSASDDVPSTGDPLGDLHALMLAYRARAREPDQLALLRLAVAQLPYQPELGECVRNLRVSAVTPVDDLIRAAMERHGVINRSVESIREILFDLMVNDVTSLALFGFDIDTNTPSIEDRWAMILAGPLSFAGAAT